MDAVKRGPVETTEPAPSAPTETDEQMLRRLAAIDPSSLEYARAKKEAADRLSLPLSSIEAAVKAKRPATPKEKDDPKPGQGTPLKLEPPEPWANPVDAAALLSEIKATLEAHVSLPPFTSIASTLWIAHTYAFENFSHTPRLAVISPEPRCGKSTKLALLNALCCKSIRADSITAPAMFRTIEMAHPTLLIDEADTFLKDSEDLRGIVNSGHARDGWVVRTVGDDHEPRSFSTFAPVAIAAIGNLPGTIMDRSVIVTMQRKMSTEKVTRFKSQDGRYPRLRSQLARMIEDMIDRGLDVAEPETPDELNDRQADGWRPLLAIADAAGAEWGEMAREAARGLCDVSAESAETIAAKLLGDLQGLFQAAIHEDQAAGYSPPKAMASKDMCDKLNAMDDRPWPEWRNRGLTPTTLSGMLRKFKISSGTVRLREGDRGTVKGYYFAAFDDAFGRYLAKQRHTVTTRTNPPKTEDLLPSHGRGCDVTALPGKPQNSAGCDGVTANLAENRDLNEIGGFLADPDDPGAHPESDGVGPEKWEQAI